MDSCRAHCKAVPMTIGAVWTLVAPGAVDKPRFADRRAPYCPIAPAWTLVAPGAVDKPRFADRRAPYCPIAPAWTLVAPSMDSSRATRSYPVDSCRTLK